MAAFIGISTDYPSRPPVPGTSDVEIGPVISGPASLGRLRELSAGEGRSLVSTLRREFDLAEDRAIAERIKLDYDAGPWRFPADQQQRAGKPLTIDQVMVDERQHDGNTLYYLTAVKAYARKAPSPCDVFVDFAVVIIRDQRGRVRSPGINAYTAFDCSRSPEGVAPLASVHWAGAPLWLVRINVDGGYDYALLDPLRAPGRPQTVQLKGLWPLRRPRNR